MAPPEETEEARELRLINQVEFAIALAETEEKLQKLLAKYLAPVLLKVMSPQEAVRSKVISIVKHVGTRIRPPTLILPVKSLLEQFMDPKAGGKSEELRKLDLTFINVGLSRLSKQERREMLPVILKGRISHFAEELSRITMFNLLLRLLSDYEFPQRGTKEDEALRALFGFDENEDEATYLAGHIRRLMLLNARSREETRTPMTLTPAEMRFLVHGVPPGSNDDPSWFGPGLSLHQVKLGALKFIASGAFTDRERFLAVLAARDAESTVADVADGIFKRTNVPLEDPDLIDEIYNMAVGWNDDSGPARPVSPTLRIHLIPLLAQSKEAVSGRWRYKIVLILSEATGSVTLRLQRVSFGLMRWAATMGDETMVGYIIIRLAEAFRDWLSNKSRPTGVPDVLVGEVYEIFGLLISRCPYELKDARLYYIRFFFDRLDNEKNGLVDNVERALGTMLVGLLKMRLPEATQNNLEEFILEIVSTDGRSKKQAVKWGGRLLPFHSVVGRWIGILAAEMGGTVAEEGSKALHPYYYRLINPEAAVPVSDSESEMDVATAMPPENKYMFPELVPLVSFLLSPDRKVPETFTNTVGNTKLPPKAFSAALSLCKTIAIWEGRPHDCWNSIKIDEDWARNTDATIFDEGIRPSIEANFSEDRQLHTFEVLLDCAWAGMVTDDEGLDGVRNTWNELATLVPQEMLNTFIPRGGELTNLLKSSKAEYRRIAVEALGLLASHQNMSEETRYQLINTLTGSDIAETDSAAALGYILSRAKMRNSLIWFDEDRLVGLVAKSVDTLITRQSQSLRDELLMDALGELLAFEVLGKDKILTIEDLRATLTARAMRGDERAVLVLAYSTFVFSETPIPVIESLLKIGEAGSVDRLFVVGEAVAAAAAAWGSSAVRRKRLIAGIKWEGLRRDTVGEVLEMLFQRAREPGGGARRKTVVVVLLCLLELCSEHLMVQEKLGEYQAIFRSFLTDREDFIQETAARGLTAVYNVSDTEVRKDLLSSLVSSFTGETREKIHVTHDTQLFEPGALPTGDGKSVGSYGDIMSLASEVGDPSLVYKFMSLARHNSVWATRAAFGRFGLGSILSNSDEIKNNPKLWPVLFRYRFDPTSTVRQSMESIWGALGGGPDTVERWWKEILTECLTSALNGREWRVRQASIGALSELLRGRKVSTYKDHLEEIWRVDFQVLDDVKESCRIEAMKLAEVLTKGMVKGLEGDIPKGERDEILEFLMKFLMGKRGIDAESQDVQRFALTTLLRVVKSGGELLRPWVPDLMEKLIMVMSQVEPEVVNYFMLNADKYNTTGAAIDQMRLRLIGGSPIMSAIETLVDVLDAPTMALTIPRITSSIRTSLALPSKVACSHTIIGLAMKHAVIFKPHADEVFKAILPALKDRSETVSKSYAVATGYLARIASDAAIIAAARGWAQSQYWTGEEKERIAAATVIAAVWKRATDRAAALASETLPFVFIAKADRDAEVAKEFEAIWTENTGGVGAVKLYLKEIIEIATEHLGSQRWGIKQTCALALANAGVAIAASGDVTVAQVDALFPALVAAVNGKSWEGKEIVIQGFVKFVVAVKAQLGDGRLAEVKKILLREAKRNNLPFRALALRSLGDFLRQYDEVDMFDEVIDFVEQVLEEAGNKDAMDMDDDSGNSDSLAEALTKNSLYCLASAYRPPAQPRFTSLYKLINTHVVVTPATPTVKLSSLQDLVYLLPKFQPGDVADKDLFDAWNRVIFHLQDRASESTRLEAVKAVKELVRITDGARMVEKGIWGRLEEVLKAERSYGVRKNLEETLKGREKVREKVVEN
ncbi:ARM repeat-containing protein [Ascodesmis nigricans]|uniref:ARM repeat-containing protein n=1 Tax=Ascodesmis nigricans TaxID=341454 RepID=A0A4S2MQL7_9PEZI|nr:ARM repeat-containing protein [Ascodesmis nigricans]